MSLLTRARFALGRMLLKASSFQIVSPWVTTSFLAPSFNALVGDGYRKNAVVFACLSALAFDFPEPPLRVYQDERDDAPTLDAHPLRKLLRRPNPLMGERELWMYTVAYAGLGGNSYWHKGRNSAGQVVQLWPYHADQISVRPGGDTWVAGYSFHEADGTTTDIPTEDIVHFKWPSPDPRQPWQAQPPLLAAAQEVDADNQATRYLRALLANDAVPRTIVRQSADRIMTDDEVRRAKSQFRASYGGDNAGGVLILEAGADVERLGLNLQELAFDALHRVPEQRIAGVLRVPLSVAGIGDDPTYSNSEEAYRRYVHSTLVPLWALWGDEVQNSLADALGVAVRHDTSRVAVLQEDQNAKWTRVTAGWGAGLLGLRESRAMLGMTADPDPDDLFVLQLARELVPYRQLLAGAPLETITVSPAPAPAQLPAPDDAPPPDGEPVNALAEEEGKAHARAAKAHEAKAAAARVGRALQRVRRAAAKKLEGRVERFFDDLAAQVVARAEDVGKAREQKDLPTIEQLLLPGDGLELGGLFRVGVLDVVRASWETWNGALDVEIAFDLEDPAVAEALGQAGARVGDITDTTRDAIRALLQYGAEQGWSIDQFVRGTDERPGLRATVAQSYAGRARTIARTEVGTAQQVAATTRYEAAGVERVEVLDGGGEDSDDICNQLNGSIQTLEWARANPLQHPNCVRAFSPHFGE